MIYGLLRVKNEARWIDRVLDSIRPVCEQTLLLDDDSTDDTREIAAAHGATVIPTPFTSRGCVDETADKDYLLSRLWEMGANVGDWCLMIDGDEALHPDDIPLVREHAQGDGVCYALRILYLWDREDQVRVDGVYASFRRPSLFKLTDRELTFRRTEFGGNFHCSSAPAQSLPWVAPSDVRLLHFGYLHREDRVRKYEWYNSVDPNNPCEDGYRHMVIGDVFPPESRFQWGGPLDVRPL